MTPPYYQGKGMQPYDVIDAFGLDFYEGNALTYLIRWRKKDGVADLHKAQAYLTEIIRRADDAQPPPEHTYQERHGEEPVNDFEDYGQEDLADSRTPHSKDELRVKIAGWKSAEHVPREVGPIVVHRWDGHLWTCLMCGQSWPDPCGCPCHEPDVWDWEIPHDADVCDVTADTMEPEIQVVLPEGLQAHFREWLQSRGLYLFGIPVEDDLPTYGVAVTPPRDPDVVRGIERVTGDRFDRRTGWSSHGLVDIEAVEAELARRTEQLAAYRLRTARREAGIEAEVLARYGMTIGELADEAERGYDVSRMRIRRRNRCHPGMSEEHDEQDHDDDDDQDEHGGTDGVHTDSMPDEGMTLADAAQRVADAAREALDRFAASAPHHITAGASASRGKSGFYRQPVPELDDPEGERSSGPRGSLTPPDLDPADRGSADDHFAQHVADVATAFAQGVQAVVGNPVSERAAAMTAAGGLPPMADIDRDICGQCGMVFPPGQVCLHCVSAYLIGGKVHHPSEVTLVVKNSQAPGTHPVDAAPESHPSGLIDAAAVGRALSVLREYGGPMFLANVEDYTDAQIDEGALRKADDDAARRTANVVRHALISGVFGIPGEHIPAEHQADDCDANPCPALPATWRWADPVRGDGD